jgi:DNA modification methylase
VEENMLPECIPTCFKPLSTKPVGAYYNLLTRSCRPGEAVFDPYCGTGTVFAAATQLKLYATGVEKSPATYAIALKRLEGLKV